MTSKVVTIDQINAAAQAFGVDALALRAVTQVECKGHGFEPSGEPVILFERHKMYAALGKIDKKLRDKAFKERPDICNPEQGGYGLESAQHGRLQAACAYNRNAALESASWGIGQVMGGNWQALGYASLQSFINAMYKDEAGQLDAMLRFIKVNGLIPAINRQDWKAFARGYNGLAYAINHYDVNLAAAYAELKKSG